MSTSFVVLKFGGTSVASKARWETIRDVLKARLDENVQPVLVCSAVAKVSDTLEALLRGAEDGDIEPHLAKIESIHATLEADLGVERSAKVQDLLDDLRKLTLGASLTREVTPRLKARVMSAGELLSTSIGSQYLRNEGLDVDWVDARDWQHAVRIPDANDHTRYLNAVCDFDADTAMQDAFSSSTNKKVTITQGFIARDDSGATVLLGRGGSDTSAAYFAAKLDAARCEIWTDVPGVFTANPKDVPTARLLRQLDYDEAQEIATTGAKVLHPRCLNPVRLANIPLEVCCTKDPDIQGTQIGKRSSDGPAQVKAISARRGITLVRMDTLGMWQQVGFLADAFACFKQHGISVDLVSTSETNVTVSIDAGATGVDDAALDALLADLNTRCKASLIGPCAAVSIVGQKIRAILHQLGPALSVFEEKNIHLLSQAASDLNLTLVVDEEDADRMVKELHALLFGERPQDSLLGPTWKTLFADEVKEKNATTGEDAWWQSQQQELLDVAQQGTPAYVYNLDKVKRQAQRMMQLTSLSRRFYAIKANSHPALLRAIYDAGMGLECVSPGELDHVFEVIDDVDVERVLFTPNFAPKEEYADALARGVHVTVDNAHPLEHWPEVFNGKEVLLRLDPGRARGHHAHVKTAGKQSKFGIAPEELEAVAALADKAGVTIKGLHAHAGSGIRQPHAWQETAMFLKNALAVFKDARILDLGGGLGVVEKPGRAPLDLDQVDASLQKVKEALPDVELWMEPGRFLVAEAGVLLAQVQQVKQKSDVRYVGVNAGMHTLIRPSLYGAFHQIVNLSKVDEAATEVAHVVGPICETGDVLGHGRSLPPSTEGDVFLVATAGAYGATMSSDYNLRPRAREVVLGG